MNSIDRLSTSTADKNEQIDVSLTETNSTAQYRSVRSTSTYGAPNVRDMHAVCVLYIALASFIYTWDYVSQKSA